MMERFTQDAAHVYLACGATDFRKQIRGLCALVNMKFSLDPYQDSCAFIFCNKRKNAIKVLRYDSNGFVLATKKLLDGMKFQWPGKSEDVKELSQQQIQWLLQGLEIEQKKAHHQVKITGENTYRSAV